MVMTIDRMIDLLKIERDCMFRKSRGLCDSHCGVCDLVQDETELDEMYTDVIHILNINREPVEPIVEEEWETPTPNHSDDIKVKTYRCGDCGDPICKSDAYCPSCGQAVKWS